MLVNVRPLNGRAFREHRTNGVLPILFIVRGRAILHEGGLIDPQLRTSNEGSL